MAPFLELCTDNAGGDETLIVHEAFTGSERGPGDPTLRSYGLGTHRGTVKAVGGRLR